MRRRQAKRGAGIGEAACCTGAVAGADGRDSIAAYAASAGDSRAVGHSAGGGGRVRARMGYGRRASVPGAAERSTGRDPSASGPGGMVHRAEYGLASWATGVSVASMSGAGQHDQASNLRGNGGCAGAGSCRLRQIDGRNS